MRVALERHLVAERTLVSAGSIAALLRRVVGKRLELQRQAIHDALLAAVGHVNPELLPDTTLMTGRAEANELSEPSRSSISLPVPSETPHAVSHSHMFLRAPVVPKRSAMLRVAVIAGGGAALAFTLMMLAGKLLGGSGGEPGGSGSAPAATEPAALRAAHPEAPGKHGAAAPGLSVSDLPLEEREERERAKRPSVVYRAPVAPAPARPAAWLEQTSTSAANGAEPSTAKPTPDAAASATATDAPAAPYDSEPESAADAPDDTKVILEEEPETPPAEAAKQKPGPYRLKVPGLKEPGF
jgi:hypothetical protein